MSYFIYVGHFSTDMGESIDSICRDGADTPIKVVPLALLYAKDVCVKFVPYHHMRRQVSVSLGARRQ